MAATYQFQDERASSAGIQTRTMATGAGFVGLTGLIHLIDAREYYGEVHYIGVLFVLTAIGAAVAAAGIVRGERWGWMLALAIGASTGLGYVLSRTVGIPMFRENSWATFLEPMGLASLAIEVILVMVAIRVLAGVGLRDRSWSSGG